jgi:DNA-binding NarL/FixJ family response regulator
MPTGETKSEAIARLKQEALVKAGIVKQESPETQAATIEEAQTRRAFLEAQIARQQAELARLAQEAEAECQTAMFSD